MDSVGMPVNYFIGGIYFQPEKVIFPEKKTEAGKTGKNLSNKIFQNIFFQKIKRNAYNVLKSGYYCFIEKSKYFF